MSYFELVGFGPQGWGRSLLLAASITLALSVCGFIVGMLTGALAAWARISGGSGLRAAARTYTTMLRGIPDLLIIYLFYFGGSAVLTAMGRLFGAEGFIGVPAFIFGMLALGVASGAYQAEVFRGAYAALQRGELEAAHSVGLRGLTLFRRIVAPQVLRYALPGLGNLWQVILKDAALVSVIGVRELIYQSQIAAGATYRPFDFYATAALLLLVISWLSRYIFSAAEKHGQLGVRRAL